jgi:RNA polymerase sigma factor (sigma-70 family)
MTTAGPPGTTEPLSVSVSPSAPYPPNAASRPNAAESHGIAESAGGTGSPGGADRVSDAALISAVRAGDAVAYGTLYQRHAAAADRLAGQIVRHPADVDDVVAEGFARVLRAIRRGGGPVEAFRPYLLTAIRRVAYDHIRGRHSQIPTEDVPDHGQPFIDPAIAGLERSLITRAFLSLPERWTAVLWHTEIEQARPAEVAALLGLTPNGVAALRYRAREGLRQAYLQLHLSGVRREECQPVADRLGAHVRGALSRRAVRRVEAHLSGCADCRAAHAELASINGSLRGLLAPVFLGGAAAAYLSGAAGHAGGAGPAAAAAGSVTGAAGGTAASAAGSSAARAGLRWVKGTMLHRPAISAAAGILLAAAIPAATLIHPHGSPRRAAGSVSAVTHLPRVTGSQGTSPGVPLTAPTQPATTTPAGSPAPSPTGQATPTPTPSPTSTSSPPLLSARLSVTVNVTGLLGLGLTAVVNLRVADPGRASTGRLDASLTLPAGVELLGLTAASEPGWSCTLRAAGADCAHGPVAAGSATTADIQILVVSLSGCGSPVLATVTSGALSASGQSAGRVQC